MISNGIPNYKINKLTISMTLIYTNLRLGVHGTLAADTGPRIRAVVVRLALGSLTVSRPVAGWSWTAAASSGWRWSASAAASNTLDELVALRGQAVLEGLGG